MENTDELGLLVRRKVRFINTTIIEYQIVPEKHIINENNMQY